MQQSLSPHDMVWEPKCRPQGEAGPGDIAEKPGSQPVTTMRVILRSGRGGRLSDRRPHGVDSMPGDMEAGCGNLVARQRRGVTDWDAVDRKSLFQASMATALQRSLDR